MSSVVGRETLVLFEIEQPMCSRTYGDGLGSPIGSPADGCQAALGVTGTHKCYNTRATCQDAARYNPTQTVTLRFSRAQEGLLPYGPLMPSLQAISTTPLSVNLAAMEKSASALGQREVVTVKLQDHLHADTQVDKYRLERKTGTAAAGSPAETFDPYARSTFWAKWLSRNPYYSSYACRVREGYVGDALADLRVRNYVLERIDGPNAGQVTLTAKDLFSKIEKKKSVAPRPSRGALGADITAVATSFTVTPTDIVEADYPHNSGSPSELRVAIGDEILLCRRSGATFSVVRRGDLGTTASAHSADDLVQLVLSYMAQEPQDIIYDLLVNYSAIAAADIPKTDWDASMADNIEFYTGHIAKPEAVSTLVGELCEQNGITVWPDVATGEVKLQPLRAASSLATVDDDAWIIADSISLSRLDTKRVSQVWVYYGQVNPLQDLEDRKNYHSRVVVVDLDAEDTDEYGVPAIREVFSRWIAQGGRTFAQSTGDRIIALFRDPPLEAKFDLHVGRLDSVVLARYLSLEAAEVVDFQGAQSSSTLAITEITRGDDTISIRAQEVAFSAASTSGRRVIYIENDSYNLNLLDVHDGLYPAPDAGSPSLQVEFIVVAGTTIGSTDAALPALRTGFWPAGVVPKLTIHGRIEGKGGKGGNGGAQGPGSAGGSGGDAFQADSVIVVDNTDGEIWAGGGGGGGGGGQDNHGAWWGGGGGGGGAGTDGGAAGTTPGVFNVAYTALPTNGAAGTADAGGAAGTGAYNAGPYSGGGGNGGDPGLVGTAGHDATALGMSEYAGGAAGAVGRYIVGNSKVTWLALGDVRGNVA